MIAKSCFIISSSSFSTLSSDTSSRLSPMTKLTPWSSTGLASSGFASDPELIQTVGYPLGVHFLNDLAGILYKPAAPTVGLLFCCFAVSLYRLSSSLPFLFPCTRHSSTDASSLHLSSCPPLVWGSLSWRGLSYHSNST
jgi:hypothetical protein